MNKEKHRVNWDKEFDRMFNYNSDVWKSVKPRMVKQFIKNLLKAQRENMIKVIEGIKPIKKLERDFKFLPNKRGIWYGGFGQAKRDILIKLKKDE